MAAKASTEKHILPLTSTPNPEHQGQEVAPAQCLAVKVRRPLSARKRGESARNPGALLKGKSTKAWSLQSTGVPVEGRRLRAYRVIRRRPGWRSPEERSGGSASESISHTALRNHLPRVGHSYSYSTSLGSTPTQSSKYWWHHPAKLESSREDSWLHPIGTSGLLFFWRNFWQTLRETLNCKALE